MINTILIQSIGGIAYAILAASYFKKEKSKILYLQIISYIMFTVHYYLLSGITGAICNIVGLFALFIIYLYEKYRWQDINFVVWIFIGILVIINIITFQNVFSIFPIIASIIVILSFLMNDEDYIRGIGLISAVCWLIYAIIHVSYSAIIFEAITVVATIVAYIKNKKH